MINMLSKAWYSNKKKILEDDPREINLLQVQIALIIIFSFYKEFYKKNLKVLASISIFLRYQKIDQNNFTMRYNIRHIDIFLKMAICGNN